MVLILYFDAEQISERPLILTDQYPVKRHAESSFSPTQIFLQTCKSQCLGLRIEILAIISKGY